MVDHDDGAAHYGTVARIAAAAALVDRIEGQRNPGWGTPQRDLGMRLVTEKAGLVAARLFAYVYCCAAVRWSDQQRSRSAG